MELEKRTKSPREVMKSMRTFIACMLVAGPVLGIVSALAYARIVSTYGTWDVSKDSFHFAIILYGLGFTFPILSISVRLMIKMFFQNCEAIENQNFILETLKIAHDKAPGILQNVEAVVDKAVPIANMVEEIVKQAKGMAEDIEKIAHRVRTATDTINGNFDFKSIEGKLEKVAESLSTIAGVFAPIKKKSDVPSFPEIPAFDPLKAGGRKD
jgi:hypothetical protein